MYVYFIIFSCSEKKKTNEMCVMTITEMNYLDNELNKMKELFIFFDEFI
jgi:hypothetical protein